jgi:hypothetical protein
MPSTRLFSAYEARVLAAVQHAFFPADIGAPLPDVARRVEETFADAKSVIRFGIRAAVWLLELSPLVGRSSRFSRLPVDERVRWLHELEASRRSSARKLYVLFKVLVQSVVYDDPAVARACGHAPPERPTRLQDAAPGQSPGA